MFVRVEGMKRQKIEKVPHPSDNDAQSPTHLVTNAAGVGDPTGQRPGAVAVVVLVHAPVFVLVAAAARELKATDETLRAHK